MTTITVTSTDFLDVESLKSSLMKLFELEELVHSSEYLAGKWQHKVVLKVVEDEEND